MIIYLVLKNVDNLGTCFKLYLSINDTYNDIRNDSKSYKRS